MESRDVSSAIERLQPVTIFCRFAPKDEEVCREIQKRLVIQEREGSIEWLKLDAGMDIPQTIQSYLQRADLILLLLSPDFLADEYCTNQWC